MSDRNPGSGRRAARLQTILVLESDERRRAAITGLLAAQGFNVRAYAAAGTLLAELATLVPDLVLTGLLLSDMTAVEVASRLREHPVSAHVPVVVCTGTRAACADPEGSFAEIVDDPEDEVKLLAAVRSALARTVRRSRAGNGRLVLVVDDDPVGLRLARIRLELVGFRVVTAASAGEALTIGRLTRPDAILSDVLMPEEDGFSLSLRLRGEPGLAQVPVVLLTASSVDRDDRELALRAGATALCARTPDLAEAIAALLASADGELVAPPPAAPAVVEEARSTRALGHLEREAERAMDLGRRCALQHAILAALATLSESLARSMDDEAALAAALEVVLDVSGISRGAVFLRDPDGAPRLVAGSRLNDPTRRALEGLARTGQALRQAMDGQELLRLTPEDQRICAGFLRQAGLRSALLAPLLSGSVAAGVLFLGSESLDLHEDDWLFFARTVGGHLGQAIGRTRSHAELALSNQRHRLLMENAADSIYLVRPDGEIVEINRAAERQLDRPASDIVGRSAWELAEGDERDRSIRRFANGTPADTYHLRGVAMRRPDGEVVYIDFAVSPVSIGAETFLLSIGRDVTARRRAEEALGASEARYRALLENVPELVWSADRERALFVSDMARSIYGFEPEALKTLGNAGFAARIHPEDRPRAEAAFAAVFDGGVPMDEEFRYLHPDGGWRWIHSRARLTRGPDGTPILEGLSGDITERKTALLRLGESETQHRTIFATSPVAMFVFELETLRILSVNDAAIRTYGYEREEFLSRTLRDVKLAADTPELERLLASDPMGTRTLPGMRHVRKDGSIVEVDITAGPITFAGRSARLVIASDVGARRRAERREAAQHAVARTLAESSTLDEAAGLVVAAIGATMGWGTGVLWDAGDGDRLRCAGDFAGGWLGNEPGGAIRTAHATGRPVHEVATGTLAWPVLAAGKVVAVIELARPAPDRPDGETEELLDAIENQLAQFIGRARSEAERDLVASDLRLIMGSTSEGICSVDLDGVARIVNPAAAALLGWTPEEIIGKKLHELCHHSRADGSSYPVHECPIHHTIVTGKPTSQTEEVLWRKDGTSFAATYHAAPILVAGAPSGAVVTFFDTTNERRLEQQLRQAQKIEAVGQLAGGVAHDFNNILSVILGSAGYLLDDLGADDPMREDIEEMKTSALRGAALTRQLLAFSRQQMVEPRLLDLNDLVANIEKMLRRLIGADIELVIGLEPGLGAVKADAGQIEQVIMNLAVNARDAMPSGGRMTIETAIIKVDERLASRLRPLEAGRYVTLTVADTGTGMSLETQRRIFEPFFTTKERGRGTGLGLSTCYGIVKQSGGTIWVDSALGRGTVIKVYLPAVGSAPGRDARPGAAQRTVGTETILLLEDDARVRRITRRILEARGYQVLEARDAREALAHESTLGRPIHLLISDIVTPGMSGLELAERLATVRPDMRVLFMSGYSEHASLRERGVPGSFLQKPFTPEELARKVRDVLDAPAAPPPAGS